MPKNRQADYLTFEGATRISRQIMQYWADKGFPNVRARPVQVAPAQSLRDMQKAFTRYDVRSDLVNGRPNRG